MLVNPYKKGFKYDIVCSYGDAIKKLLISENNICPYSDVWFFYSKGNGSLPEKVKIKIQIRLQCF